MTGEDQPHPLEATLFDRSYLDWREWLCRDRLTGEDHAHDVVPVSRYGDQAWQCAWWAINAMQAYVSLGGDADEPEEMADYFMGLAVNDRPDVAELIIEAWDDLPEALTQMIGELDDVRGMV